MQLMCDAVSVLGSRHGILVNPITRHCRLIRFDRFESLPAFHLKAGAIINGKEVIFPLAPAGDLFGFLDQRITPCQIAFIGIDPSSGLKVKLTLTTPFKPRDPDFSTTPVLAVRLEASLLAGQFRWEPRQVQLTEATLFVEIGGPDLRAESAGDDRLALHFKSRWNWDKDASPIDQCDQLVVVQGQKQGTRLVQKVSLAPDAAPSALDLAWCAYPAPGLQIQKRVEPFRFTRQFAGLDAVIAWARVHYARILENASHVERIATSGQVGQNIHQLMALTLHSWLINTWWINRQGREWFSVWEGNCYLQSTVDVEYTQSPFYLAVWPELLGYELDAWPEYSKAGDRTLGARGRDTLFLSHDMGSGYHADGQAYTHEMEVEETANYLILSYAYWRRTGDDRRLHTHADTLIRYLAFLKACDSTGNGIPDQGVANTIDDASPAVQYGKEQTYLAVKTLAAFKTGAVIFEHLKRPGKAREYRRQARLILKTIQAQGWVGDHFAVLLDRKGENLVDPWTHKTVSFEAVPGWDAEHIYTANGITPLDMVGFRVGLDERQIRKDLEIATQRCLREYGCIHSNFESAATVQGEGVAGLFGTASSPGWVAMNMLRDIAAFYRGLDFRHLAERYWNWQTTTNSREPKLFFETFCGNNLCFYPRGLAIWGFYDGLAGLVIDAVTGTDRATPRIAKVPVPRLFDADWATGHAQLIESQSVKS